MRSFSTLSSATLIFTCVLLSNRAWSQVAIGTSGTSPTPNSKAVLLLEGKDQGLILPVVSGLTAVAATGSEKGMVVFNSGDNKVYYFDGTDWLGVGSGGTGSNLIQISGNTITLGVGASSVNLATGFSNSARGFLYWNGTSWVQAQFTLPSTTQALVYNPGTSSWGFQTLSAGGGITTLSTAGTYLTVANPTGPTATITANPITNTDISATAAIAGSKVTPSFGAQNISTTGTLTTGAATVSGLTIGTSLWPANASGVLTNNGTGTLTWAAAPNPILGGDLSGTASAATVSRLQGQNVSATAPTAGQVLQFISGSWTPSPLTGGGTVTNVTASAPINVATGSTTPALSLNPLTDTDISATAAIAGTKINPAFGAQNITTTTGSASIGGGLNVGLANGLEISNAGNFTRINNIATSFPAAQGAANTYLRNDGAGNLSWSAVAGGTDVTTQNGVLTGNGSTITGVASLPVSLGGTGATSLTGLVVGNGTSAFTAITTGTNGQVLTVNAGVPSWQNPTTSGAAGGDLIGTYPNPTIATGAVTSSKIATGAVGTTNIAAAAVDDSKIANVAPGKILQASATTGQVLKWNGSTWAPAPDAVGGGGAPTLNPGQIIVGDGSTNSGATMSLDASLNSTNGNVTVQGLQGRPISTAVPASNSVYQFNGTQWAPVVLSSGGTVSSIATGTGLTGGPITGTGTISIAPGGVTSTELATGAVGNTNIAASAVNSAQIVDGTITDTDISGTAAIAVTKLATGTNGQVLTVNAGVPSWQTPSGGGSVTTVSVTSANGFTGSVATPTSTPAITIGTSLIGLLKGNGTALALATAGTDYQAPITLTTTGTSGAATLVGNTLNVPNYSSTAYIAGTGLTLTTNTFSVNTSQNISTLSNLTTNGLVKTSGGTGALSIATAGTDYLTPTGSAATLTGFPILNQNTTGSAASFTGALAGDVTGTQGATVIASNAVNSAKIADGTIADTDIATGAAIAGTKINPNFGTQNISTTGSLTTGTAGAFAVNTTGNITKINNVTTTFPAANAAGVLTNDGTGTLTWAAGSGWALGGNTGTVDGAIGTGTNYIGTKDNIPLNFIANNQKAGRIEQLISGSTFLGWTSGNVNTGAQNAAFGSQAMEKNTTGGVNAAFGQLALNNNTTGQYNVAVGAIAMSNNTSGGNNIAIGVQANNNNTIGSGNTAIGYNANYSNASSGFNTIVGIDAGFNNTGANNTGIGRRALFNNTTGSNNTALGYQADVGASFTNATAIGANASATASNTIQLGDATVTTVNVGTGTTAKLVAGQLQITGGTLGAGRVLTSDASGNATWQAAGGSGWSLTGNAGTVDGTNFIGTTDFIPLNFRVGGIGSGRIDPVAIQANTFFGYSSGSGNSGTISTGFGFQTLQANTGSNNTAFGSYSMVANTSGFANTAVGSNALRVNTTGAANTALGVSTLAQNTTGGNNTAIGGNVLNQNTTGTENTAVGTQSMQLNTAGASNTAMGFYALLQNQANNNVAMGWRALESNNTGAGNTAIGTRAGYTAIIANANVSGSNNTFIGFNSGPGTVTQLSNAMAIGANATVSANNTVQLGDANVTTVNVGTGTTAKLVAGQLQVTGGTLGAGRVLTSDASGNATWQTSGATLISNPGTFNLFAGSGVSTASTDNAIFGANAGANNTGPYNVIIGANAAINKTTGSLSTIIGWFAGKVATNDGNTLIGAQAGENATGSINTFLGEKAGQTSTTGIQNTFIGDRAGSTPPEGGGFGNTTGSNNMALGTFATLQSGALTNATAIGYRATVSQSNSIVLGSINGVNTATSNTNVGIGTTAPATELHVTHGNGSPAAGNGLTIQNVGASNQNFAFFVSNSTGNLNLYDNNTFVGGFAQVSGTYTPVSDRRFKKNILPLEEILPKLKEVQIRRYHFKKQNDTDVTNIGVIAQELKEVFPELVKYSPENDRYTVDYQSMGPLAIKAIQEQQEKIKSLEEKLNNLEYLLGKERTAKIELRSQVDKLNEDMAQIKRALGLDAKVKKD